MARTLTQKLIDSHLAPGGFAGGDEISLVMDQVLLQDVLGTLVMLELEAMGVDRVKPAIAVQYVDHNLVQNDNLNHDEHLFLQSACQRFGLWYSRPGNGISHPVHMQRFGVPGATMVGSDSHTPAAGALGMLAIGAGGIEVALALAGEPLCIPTPEVWGVHLRGRLPAWVSAKDVILEMLRRHGVRGGIGRVIEYYGDGLAELTAWDRHVIANMGAELGATSSVFPSDEEVRRFLASQGREECWQEILADPGADYDHYDEIDLSALEPLIALPSSPDNVKPVRECEGLEIAQAYIGSSANPGYRDFAIAAHMVREHGVHPGVSFDINPSSRQTLEALVTDGWIAELIRAGARLHQAGCNGCIGMGQAPALGRRSLRTVPRNFPGRSGTREDSVYLCSPETATAAAITGRITDPRSLGLSSPSNLIEKSTPNPRMFVAPLPPEEARKVSLAKTDNITSLPALAPLPDSLELPILLKVGDNVSTDEIMPAGARVLPYWSSIERCSAFTFEAVDPTYVARAKAKLSSGHIIAAGWNYGQGSSRENAALAPRYLGLRMVVAQSFSRIHWQNLVNFGVLPLRLETADDMARLQVGDTLTLRNIHAAIRHKSPLEALSGSGDTVRLLHDLSDRQAAILLDGGVINQVKARGRP